MRIEHWAGLDVCITGGSDGKGGGEGPTVVLLHGFGAPGDDLVPLAQFLTVPQGTRFAFPAAPLTLPMGWGDSRAWWMIDMEQRMQARAEGRWEELSQDIPRGLQEARTQIMECLEMIKDRLQVSPSTMVIGGFSQGAMLSLDVTLHAQWPLAGLVILSGALIAKNEWLPRLPDRRGLPVFQSHGAEDPILDFGTAQQLRDHLQTAGLHVEWVEFDGGHEIPLPVLHRLGQFLQLRGPHS